MYSSEYGYADMGRSLLSSPTPAPGVEPEMVKLEFKGATQSAPSCLSLFCRPSSDISPRPHGFSSYEMPSYFSCLLSSWLHRLA